jgi:phage-related protein
MRKATDGILFGDVHSFNDLNLVLTKMTIPPAKAKTTYVEIPGADGSLDLTETHGDVKYSDREITFNFAQLPSDDTDFETKKTEISNLLNGKACKITLDADEDYYYQGRCSVNDHLQDGNLKTFTVKAKVRPYKYKQYMTKVIVKLTEATKTVVLTNGRKSVAPSIECTNDNTVISFGAATFNLSAGTHKILDIMLVEGENTLTTSGTGSVTFSYQEGDL